MIRLLYDEKLRNVMCETPRSQFDIMSKITVRNVKVTVYNFVPG